MPETPWMEIAENEIGVCETKGGETPRILEYHDCTTLDACEDEIPWCSAFANWVMVQAGFKGTNLANARSWLKWGTQLARPEYGCIVVLKRGDSPTSGHVGFYAGSDDQFIRVLGGNQGDQVKYSNYRRSDVLGYRWPV